MTCKVTPIAGGAIFTCGHTKPTKRCKFCDAPCEKLCDFELTGAKAGQTCSAPMCHKCTTTVGSGMDLCPPHKRFVESKSSQLANDAKPSEVKP